MVAAQHAEHKRLYLAGVEKHLASMNPELQTSQFLTEEKFGRIHSVLEEWAEADGPARKALQKEGARQRRNLDESIVSSRSGLRQMAQQGRASNNCTISRQSQYFHSSVSR